MQPIRRLTSIAALVFLSSVLPRPAAAIDGCHVVDLNGNGVVEQGDRDLIEADLGLATPRFDLDGSGLVDDADVAILWSYRKTCPAGCRGDLSGDHAVGALDRILLEVHYGFDCRADLNRDGKICPRDSEVMDAYMGSATPLSPSAARADLDNDGDVDKDDADLLATLHVTNCAWDLNRDGAVDTNDLGAVLAAWGACSGPAPLSTKGDPAITCAEEDPDP